MNTTLLVALIVLITFAVIGITRTVQRLSGRRSGNRNNRLDMQYPNRDNRLDEQNRSIPVEGALLWDGSQAQEQQQHHHHHGEASQQHHMHTPVQHHVPPPTPPIHHAPPPIQHHMPPPPPPMHH